VAFRLFRSRSPARIADRPLAERGCGELRDVADAEVVRAYEELRDAAVDEGGVRVYPGVRRIAGTPFEREKDRREVRARASAADVPEMHAWYASARDKPCTWWLDNHVVARHSLRSCMNCGVCTSVCPAAEFYEDYSPRQVVDAALSRDEERILALLRADTLWLCGQCGSCKPRCTRRNNVMGLVSSLRQLAQLKGCHVDSVRGRQQYAARHLWGGSFWNRGCSLYFRAAAPEEHRDFGPRFARLRANIDAEMRRVGADPDADGRLGGRKLAPATIEQLRGCVREGGTLALWSCIEEAAAADADRMGVDLDAYHDRVRREG
jgi:heterodisulfide reductase subunit C